MLLDQLNFFTDFFAYAASASGKFSASLRR